MDDCNLKSLKVKPGELSPIFRPDIVEYKATVGSKVAKITILCETSDRDASVSISVSSLYMVRAGAANYRHLPNASKYLAYGGLGNYCPKS